MMAAMTPEARRPIGASLVEPEPVGWVLYDGSCGVCSRWVPSFATTLKKRGLAIAPLQAEWVAPRLNASSDELLTDLRLLLQDGGQLRVADASIMPEIVNAPTHAACVTIGEKCAALVRTP